MRFSADRGDGAAPLSCEVACMVDAWGSADAGGIMGTTAPEIGHNVLQTVVAALTSDAGQRERVVLDCL